MAKLMSPIESRHAFLSTLKPYVRVRVDFTDPSTREHNLHGFAILITPLSKTMCSEVAIKYGHYTSTPPWLTLFEHDVDYQQEYQVLSSCLFSPATLSNTTLSTTNDQEQEKPNDSSTSITTISNTSPGGK